MCIIVNVMVLMVKIKVKVMNFRSTTYYAIYLLRGQNFSTRGQYKA